MFAGVTSRPVGHFNAQFAGIRSRAVTATSRTAGSYRPTHPAISALARPTRRATFGKCARLPQGLPLRPAVQSPPEQRGYSCARAPRACLRCLLTSRVRRATLPVHLRRGRPASQMRLASACRWRHLIELAKMTAQSRCCRGPATKQSSGRPGRVVSCRHLVPALNSRLSHRVGQPSLPVLLQPQKWAGLAVARQLQVPGDVRSMMPAPEAALSRTALPRLVCSRDVERSHQLPRLPQQKPRLLHEPISDLAPAVLSFPAARRSQCSVGCRLPRGPAVLTTNWSWLARVQKAQPGRRAGPVRAPVARAIPLPVEARDQFAPVLESRFSKPFQRNAPQTEVAQSARESHQLWRLLVNEALRASAGRCASPHRRRCFFNVKRRAACRS